MSAVPATAMVAFGVIFLLIIGLFLYCKSMIGAQNKEIVRLRAKCVLSTSNNVKIESVVENMPQFQSLLSSHAAVNKQIEDQKNQLSKSNDNFRQKIENQKREVVNSIEEQLKKLTETLTSMNIGHKTRMDKFEMDVTKQFHILNNINNGSAMMPPYNHGITYFSPPPQPPAPPMQAPPPLPPPNNNHVSYTPWQRDDIYHNAQPPVDDRKLHMSSSEKLDAPDNVVLHTIECPNPPTPLNFSSAVDKADDELAKKILPTT